MSYPISTGEYEKTNVPDDVYFSEENVGIIGLMERIQSATDNLAELMGVSPTRSLHVADLGAPFSVVLHKV